MLAMAIDYLTEKKNTARMQIHTRTCERAKKNASQSLCEFNIPVERLIQSSISKQTTDTNRSSSKHEQPLEPHNRTLNTYIPIGVA